MNHLLNNLQSDNQQAKLFYIVAGESSGDILGARLIDALKLYFPKAKFCGIGGVLMQQAGLQSYYPMDRLSVMGIAPIIVRLPELLRMRRRLAKAIVKQQTDCFIGIDAPVFNTDLELMLKEKGVTTVHYVSPSVWAWRENRIHKIVKSVSLMICLFPFELDIYKRHHLPAVCIGHPLADEIPLEVNCSESRKELQLPMNGKILAILPGSRGSEMKFLLEPFLNSAQVLAKKYPELSFVIPCANEKRKAQLKKYIQQNNVELDLKIIDGQSRQVMQAANYVLLASGTATLEAMLLKKPMLVAYKVSGFSYWIYSKFLKIKNFSLPNLLANKKLVVELMQDDCTQDKLVNQLSQLIDSDSNRALIQQFDQLHQDLQRGGSQKAAKAIADLVNNKT